MIPTARRFAHPAHQLTLAESNPRRADHIIHLMSAIGDDGVEKCQKGAFQPAAGTTQSVGLNRKEKCKVRGLVHFSVVAAHHSYTAPAAF